MYAPWENAIALALTYYPYTILFLYAFHKNFRFSPKITYGILLLSGLIRISTALFAKSMSSTAVIACNYIEIVLMILLGFLAVKAKFGRLLFTGLILKNTADAIVIFAKFAEHLVVPDWADLGYHWTYSVSLLVCELILLPPVFLFIRKFFTNEIRETISRRWRILWLVPFFFYLSWIYIFYYSTDKTDLEQACLPVNSIYLLLSISCQYLIYACIATLVESLQNEAKLQAENHAILLQNVQYEYIRAQIDEDRKLRHDMRHHFTTLEAFAENHEYDKLTEYLKKYVASTSWRSKIQYCSNNVLNIMTTYYANRCYSDKINIQISLQIPEVLPLNDTETAIVFGNLLENAFDACSKVTDENRCITFRGALLNNNFVFSIENSFIGDVKRNSLGGFMSTKHNGEAVGISSCRDIIERHNGSIDFHSESTFKVDIMLPQNSFSFN